ncbi:MAG TPA: hypothetical protein ENJ62_06395, partial [Bryobacterales bacterium]|nr:hypothetical protein [Bryobacterales bacterium]
MSARFLALFLASAALAAAAEPMAFRIVFGDRRDRPADYSGSIQLTAGKVERIEPWRFLDGDSVQGTSGWKLTLKRRPFENQPDKPRRMMADPQVINVVPAGVVVTVDAPATAAARVRTAQGSFEIPLAELRRRGRLRFLDEDVVVERAPLTQRVSPPSGAEPPEQFDYPSMAVGSGGELWVAWQGYLDLGEHVYVRRFDGSTWGEAERLTDKKGDIFRTAAGIDARGRVWVVWGERDGRTWHLHARRRENGQWGSKVQITREHGPNTFHRLAADGEGNLHLVWIGHDGGQSYVYWSRLSGDEWSAPQRISGPSAWNPEAAADSGGNLWVVWDSYRTGNYDVFLRRVGRNGALGEEMQVTKSSLFQAHPTVAVDKQDRVWVAWHESGANWGKDWTHEDPERGTVLYVDRRPKVAVYENGRWRQPATDLISAIPLRYRRYVQYPRLAADAQGRIWCALQVRTSTAHNRGDYWAFDGRWEFYLTTLDGDRWRPAMPLPNSSSRPEGTMLVAPDGPGVRLVWANDNRPLFAKAFYARIPTRYEIWSAAFADAGPAPQLRFEDFAERNVNIRPVHPNEPQDLERIRSYRLTYNGRTLRILR